MPKPLLQIEDLTKSYGDRLLFGDVTFGVNEGDKIGVIAKNGTGKSTLLSIIAGDEAADSGEIVFRNDLKIGYLEQTPRFEGSETVIASCLIPGTPATDAVIAYEQAIAADDPDRIAEAIHAMDAAAAWDYEDRVKQMLHQLGIIDLTAPVGTLSGGQQKRVAIARMLLSEPQLIILDEPTNHLDISVIEWLEAYLSRSRATLLMVTHDRYFLDRVCNKIIEIDQRAIFVYEGNYDYYLRRRQERIEALTGELAKVKNTLRKETEWMRRQPQARAGKAKYRIDQYYDLKARSQADYTERNVKLEVKSSYIGSKIFEAEHVSKRFGDTVILDDFTYTFSRYEKLGIIGRNGAGKSTFIKMLQGLVEADAGRWNIGETVRFGYYSQEGIAFDENKRVIDAVTEYAEEVTVDVTGGDVPAGVRAPEAGRRHYSPMQFLTRFLFTPADQQKYIRTLSGGERARLHLATVLMRSPNFLILDEPTNDLDIVTLGILEEYLASFSGCLIIVSHDRFFLDSIVDHLFVFEGQGVIKDFPGGYTDYRNYLAEQRAAEQAAPKPQAAPKEKPRSTRDTSNKLSFKERRELEQLTAEIDTLEAEIAQLDALFASGQTIDDVAEKSARYTQLKTRLDDISLRWLELSEKE